MGRVGIMGKLWAFLKEHGGAITAVLLLLTVALYAGNLQQRVASAEEEIKTVRDQMIKADTKGEDRVVRIYDKLEGFSKKLDDFTKEQRDHLIADANHNRDIAISLQAVSNDLKAIKEELNRRKRQ